MLQYVAVVVIHLFICNFFFCSLRYFIFAYAKIKYAKNKIMPTANHYANPAHNSNKRRIFRNNKNTVHNKIKILK